MAQTSSRPQSSWIGQTIASRYKIESLLGQGGMSTVYLAHDPNLRRNVAVKLIHPHLSNDAQFIRRFEQEAAAVAQLRHPNIIQVYDFNHDNGLYYMILEYVPGETLQARLTALNASQQRLSVPEIVHITAAVCDAAAYAHERGMIHRDLKPANVMLNPQGQPILMDFGVAKMLGESHQTATGSVVGTALYMSPEQARGERPDERSDIYSIGVMLFEMITGAPPFKADSAVSLMMKHVTQPVPDIRQINQTVPDLLVAVTKKALVKDPAERYRTAADMAVALRAIEVPHKSGVASSVSKIQSSGELPALQTISGVLPPSAAVKPAKKSNPLVWVIGIIGLLFLIGIGAGVLWLFFGGRAVSTGATLPSAEGMIKIGAGSYTVGRETTGQNYAPVQQVKLNDFWLDEYETTNAQYAKFVAATRQKAPAAWPDGKMPAGKEDFPVQGVTWDMSAAYCAWANKRLPSEAEWEVAARGSDGRLYPWGNDQKAVKLPQSDTYKVGSKPTNQSAFGIFDMAGNVWEWVGDTYAPVAEGNRVLRGGENGFLKDMAYRLVGPPDQESMINAAGLRCAADKVSGAAQPTATVEGVLAQDSFANPGSGWPILSEGSYLYGYHPPDFYHVEVGQPEAHTVVSREPNFDNVVVETNVKVDHTTTETGTFQYGLALRRSGDNYYAFAVSPRSGTWQVLKSSSAGLEVLKEGKVDTLRGIAPSGFTPDKTDTLTVNASGSTFSFQINGQPVADISDSAYTSGEVGFFVQTADETLAHIHYDTLTVRQAGSAPQGSAAPPASQNLLEDSFADPQSGWPVAKDEKYVIGYHPPDYYHVQVAVPNDRAVVSYPNKTFEDATIETQVLVDHTDTEQGNFRYGLVWRRSGDNYYAFVVSYRTGTWQALKSSAQGLEVLAEGKTNALAGFAPPGATPDKTDTLRVDVKGNDFILHINGQPVGQVSGSGYAGGEVGFMVETFDETLAHVHYEQLTVREVEFEPTANAPNEGAATATSTPTATTETAGVPPQVTEEVIILPTATPAAPVLIAEATEEATEPASATVTPTAAPDTPTPTKAAPTDTPKPPTVTREPATPVPAPKPRNMALVPAGYFQMGSATGQANEKPEHPVFVDAFYIDLFEVSNAQYRQCVAAGGCTAGNKADSFTYQGYRDNPTYDNYPMVGVTWDQARAYCSWAGKRLVTEAEWEYAAGGPQNFTWPWGNSFDASLSAASAPDAQPVDSFAQGVSPFGVYNMAGNVTEWVADTFDENFYANSPVVNPVNSSGGAGRIFRGGSFGNPDGAFYTTSRRYGNANSFNDVDVGFRCAQDAAGATPADTRQTLLAEFCQVYLAYKPGGPCP
ncbi:MAG: SUMF1/EgtB/PvdO family nonheme iron enzyme [Anaerolineae bacterium]